MPRWTGALVGLLIAALIAGCGFRLRGQIDLPPELAVIRVSAPPGHAEFVSALERSLRASGAEVLTEPSDAVDAAVLDLEAVQFERRTVAVGSAGQALEYRLTYRASAVVRGPDGEPLLESLSVQVAQEFAFDERQVLGSAQEQARLREAMEDELANRLLSRIQRLLAARDADG